MASLWLEISQKDGRRQLNQTEFCTRAYLFEQTQDRGGKHNRIYYSCLELFKKLFRNSMLT